MASREHRWRRVLVVSAFLAATTSLVWSGSPGPWPGGKSAHPTLTSYQEPRWTFGDGYQVRQIAIDAKNSSVIATDRLGAVYTYYVPEVFAELGLGVSR